MAGTGSAIVIEPDATIVRMCWVPGEVLEVTLGIERLVDEAQGGLEGLAAEMSDEIALAARGGGHA